MGRGASLRHGSLSARSHPSALERAVECRPGMGAPEPNARGCARCRARSVACRGAGRSREARDVGTHPLRRGSGVAGVAWSRSGGRRDERASIEPMIDGTVQWHHSHSTRIVCPRPQRARSAGGAPLQGAHNAEPGLSARGHDNGSRVRSLLRALRGRARPEVRPYRAHTNAEPGLSARGHDNGTRVRSLLRALRGGARPKVRPYRTRTNAEPGLSARGDIEGLTQAVAPEHASP